MRLLPLLALTLFACKAGTMSTDDDDTGTSGADTGGGDDTSGGGDDTSGGGDDTSDREPVAELATLSSGECPDMTSSNTDTFLSSGAERKVTTIIPLGGGDGASVVVFFHGLTSPDASPEPTVEMAELLELQDLADATNTIILLPEAPLRDAFGTQFYLWDVEQASDADLVLFDDLRTCVAEAWAVDLWRFSAMGFSGGALFTTVVASNRADTLATFVEMSGGSDVDVVLFDEPIARWAEPARTLPGLLFSGGANDVWPNSSFKVVDFVAATDTLEQKLIDGGHEVVRCSHNSGHTITQAEYSLTLRWIAAHTFGEPSPFAEEGLGDDADWCVGTFPQ